MKGREPERLEVPCIDQAFHHHCYPIPPIVAPRECCLPLKLFMGAHVTTRKTGIPVPVVIALLAGAALAQTPIALQQPALTTVKNVIYNEMHPASPNNIHWKYRLTKVSGAKEETRTVIETQSGSLDRLVAVGGQPLSGAQQADEVRRILKFAHNSDAQRKAQEARRKDAAQCDSFLNMIPNAFLFEYAGENGTAIKLTFKPNPRFQAPSREGRVLQQMAGEMWVDGRQQRLISISGHLMNEVKFGGGFLGHLEKGGEFTVKRSEIAPGVWELTELTVNMQGKALFFKSIAVQQKEVHSNFERMPDELTLTDAANVLLKQTLIAANR